MSPVVLVFDPLPESSPDDTFTFRFVDDATPVLTVNDHGILRGDGVFETLGGCDGRLTNVNRHLERLTQSAHSLAIPRPNIAQWQAAIREALGRLPQAGEIIVRLVLTRGVDETTPSAWVYATVAPDYSRARRDGVSVVTLDRGYPRGIAASAPWLLVGAKTLSYSVNMAALREAHKRGADDVIFVSHDDFVMEGPTSSVLFRTGNSYITPELESGILHGTTQQAIFDYLAFVRKPGLYQSVTKTQLLKADAAWLVSSVRLAVPIHSIDSRRIPVDRGATDNINNYLLRGKHSD